jgi:hypothetical protein
LKNSKIVESIFQYINKYQLFINGRGLNADPEKIITTLTESSITRILKNLVKGDTIEITQIHLEDNTFIRQPSSYGHIPYNIRCGIWDIEDVDCDPAVRPKNIRAIMLKPHDITIDYYMIEYVTTDGFLREIEEWGIIGKICELKKI